MNAIKKYTVRCIEGADQSMSAADCIDRFQILGDGVPLFTVSFDYATANHAGDCDARVRCLTPDGVPSLLPFINSGIHLIGFLHEWLMTMSEASGAEFFANMFCDDDGMSIELPIEFAVNP